MRVTSDRRYGPAVVSAIVEVKRATFGGARVLSREMQLGSLELSASLPTEQRAWGQGMPQTTDRRGTVAGEVGRSTPSTAPVRPHSVYRTDISVS